MAFPFKNSFPEVRQMPQWFRPTLLLQKTRIWFPTPTSGGTQVPVNSSSRGLVLSSDLPRNLYSSAQTPKEITTHPLRRVNAQTEVTPREPESGSGPGHKHCFSDATPPFYTKHLSLYLCVWNLKDKGLLNTDPVSGISPDEGNLRAEAKLNPWPTRWLIN